MLTYNDLELITEEIRYSKIFPVAKKLNQQPVSIWIASGLAKISAIYGAFLMEKYAQRPSYFSTPLRYLQNPTSQNIPILISLRGKHPDSIAVADFFAQKHISESIFLTADNMGNAARLLQEHGLSEIVIDTKLPARDQRTVNFNSIFILTSLVHKLVTYSLEDSNIMKMEVRLLEKLFEDSKIIANDFVNKLANIQDWSEKQFIILSDGVPSALCQTWQSIMSEAGLFTPACSDIKDYTHGDHLSAVRTKHVVYIVISHPETRSITDIFCKRFSLFFPVLHIQLADSGFYGFWQNLFIAMNCASILTASLGYPNQRLPKNLIVHNWRGWGNI